MGEKDSVICTVERSEAFSCVAVAAVVVVIAAAEVLPERGMHEREWWRTRESES